MKKLTLIFCLLGGMVSAQNADLFKLSQRDSLAIAYLESISEEEIINDEAGFLKAGLYIPLVISTELGSDNYVSEIIKVKNDITDNKNNILISGGSKVRSQVITVPSRAIGKPGSISISITSVQAVDGQEILLSGAMQKQGKNYSGLLWGTAIGGCFIITPLSFFALLTHGEKVVIPAGTEINATVSKNYQIKIN